MTAIHLCMAGPKSLCLLCFTCYQCIIISLWYCDELEITSVYTTAIYNPHVLDKRQRSEEDAMFSKSCPVISMWILFYRTDNLEITPSLSVYHICFNHYIVYEIGLKGGGSFVQVLFGKILAFFEMVMSASWGLWTVLTTVILLCIGIHLNWNSWEKFIKLTG